MYLPVIPGHYLGSCARGVALCDIPMVSAVVHNLYKDLTLGNSTALRCPVLQVCRVQIRALTEYKSTCTNAVHHFRSRAIALMHMQ
jgi:hypothetical protein